MLDVICPAVVVAALPWHDEQLDPSPGEPVLAVGDPPGYISVKLLNKKTAAIEDNKGKSLIFINLVFNLG